jgi:hypothetical protein
MPAKGLPVRKRPKAIHIKPHCGRCGRKLAYRGLVTSMLQLDDGFPGDTICADCLSPEECGHMAWLEATSEAALNVRDNRILTRMRRDLLQ